MNEQHRNEGVSTMRTKLEAKVAAVNRANAYANELAPRLRAAFEPFLGQKIFTAAGPLMKSVKQVVDALNLPSNMSNRSLNVYRYNIGNTIYSVCYVVQANEPEPGASHEVSVYVGEVSDGVLTKMMNGEAFRTDYTAANVQAARDTYQAAKKAASAAESALHPFGEYDR